jgi:type IV pilus assembly protein PilE
MIAVAVVALLSMIAMPSFMESVRKSKRVDAHTAMTRTSYNLERRMATNGQYTSDATLLGLIVDDDGAWTDDRHYNISVAGGAGGLQTSYVITATAAAGGMQEKDTGCTVLTLDSLGRRTPDPVASRCW